jgi:hypothetical protein
MPRSRAGPPATQVRLLIRGGRKTKTRKQQVDSVFLLTLWGIDLYSLVVIVVADKLIIYSVYISRCSVQKEKECFTKNCIRETQINKDI